MAIDENEGVKKEEIGRRLTGARTGFVGGSGKEEGNGGGVVRAMVQPEEE